MNPPASSKSLAQIDMFSTLLTSICYLEQDRMFEYILKISKDDFQRDF